MATIERHYGVVMPTPRQRADEHRLDTVRILIRQLDAAPLTRDERRYLRQLKRENRDLTARVKAANPAWRSKIQRAKRWARLTLPPAARYARDTIEDRA